MRITFLNLLNRFHQSTASQGFAFEYGFRLVTSIGVERNLHQAFRAPSLPPRPIPAPLPAERCKPNLSALRPVNVTASGGPFHGARCIPAALYRVSYPFSQKPFRQLRRLRCQVKRHDYFKPAQLASTRPLFPNSKATEFRLKKPFGLQERRIHSVRHSSAPPRNLARPLVANNIHR